MSNKKVCVVGAGYWGKNHIRTLNDLDALGGIVEENKNLLDQISEQYPDAKTYQNLNEALSHCDESYLPHRREYAGPVERSRILRYCPNPTHFYSLGYNGPCRYENAPLC